MLLSKILRHIYSPDYCLYINSIASGSHLFPQEINRIYHAELRPRWFNEREVQRLEERGYADA